MRSHAERARDRSCLKGRKQSSRSTVADDEPATILLAQVVRLKTSTKTVGEMEDAMLTPFQR